jgi:hypothetical protein
MIKCILILSLFGSIPALAQTPGKKYSFPEIGWSLALPADFTDFPSADRDIQIHPGSKADSQSPSKRLMNAMSDANVFTVRLQSCDPSDAQFYETFSESNKRTYLAESKGEGGIQCDSATTTALIDGVPFQKFGMVVKKNGLIQHKSFSLATCYKGYTIYITYMTFSKKAGAELESMLDQSKFSK